MKKNYFSNSLKLIFILFLLLSCSDSYEQNEEDITPTPAPQQEIPAEEPAQES